MCKQRKRYTGHSRKKEPDLSCSTCTENIAMDSTSEGEFEIPKKSFPGLESTRGIIREVFEAEIALWTVCISGLWTYVWSSRKRFCVFNTFIVIPFGLGVTCCLSWMLACVMVVGRVLFGSPQCGDAGKWIVTRLPKRRKRSGNGHSADANSGHAVHVQQSPSQNGVANGHQQHHYSSSNGRHLPTALRLRRQGSGRSNSHHHHYKSNTWTSRHKHLNGQRLLPDVLGEPDKYYTLPSTFKRKEENGIRNGSSRHHHKSHDSKTYFWAETSPGE